METKSGKTYANPNKWVLSEIEDGGGGVVPYEYKKRTL